MAIGRISRFILALFATILLIVAPVSQVLAEEPVPVLTPTFTFAALPLPTPTYGTGELAIQRSSAPDATSYKFTATIMGNGVFVGTNNSRTYVLNTDPLHGGASAQYIICVPEVVMINVANSTGTVVASLEAGANKAGSKDLRSCPESPSVPADADNDGVLDDGTDKCLGTPAGTVVDKTTGCAVVIVPEPVDTDKDGINDDVDQCDNEAGPASNNGCAIRDADNDGVLDDGTDKCVDVAGPASNGGCPVVVSPKKAAVCKYVGTPGVDERLQTGQNPIVVDRKDWMVIGSPFQDAHGRSIVIAFLNPQDPEPSVDQCPAPEGPPSPKLVTAVNGTFTDLCGDVFNLSFQSAHIEGINYVVVRDGNSLTVHAEVTDAAKYKLANPGWQQVQTDTLTACPTESTHITLNPPDQKVVCGPNNDVVTPADQPNGVKLVGNPVWMNGKWIVAYSPIGPNVVIDGLPSFELIDAATTCPTSTVPPKTCPQGKVWKDGNGNGLVDDGECSTPAVVPPAVVVTEVEVAIPGEHSKKSATNGRGFNVETGITGSAAAVQGKPASDDQSVLWVWPAGLLVIAAVVATAANSRRQTVSAK